MEIRLPEEIILEIASYLDARDVLSCSSVNKIWRNSLNNNKLWRDLCRRHFAVISPSPISERCRVKPRFKPPIVDCDELTPLCNWKIRFLQQLRIARNWRRGNFSIEKIEPKVLADLKRLNRHTIDETHIDDEYLISYFMSEKRFRIWRFTQKGIIETESIEAILQHEMVSFSRLLKNGFIYVQENMLVYHLKKGDGFELKFQVAIDEDVDFLKKNQRKIFDNEQYRENFYSKVYSFFCNDKYFVAPFANNKDFFFHIWDLDKGYKKILKVSLKEEAFDVTSYIPDDNSQLNFYFHYAYSQACDIYSYNFAKESLQKFLVENKSEMIFFMNLAISFRRDKVHIYNLKNGEIACIDIKDKMSVYDYGSIISCDYIGIINEHYGKIRLINLKTLIYEGDMKIKRKCNSHCIQYFNTQFIHPDMLLVDIDLWDFRRRCEPFAQLWDIKKRKKFSCRIYPSERLINPSRTKLLDFDSGQILHFW